MFGPGSPDESDDFQPRQRNQSKLANLFGGGGFDVDDEPSTGSLTYTAPKQPRSKTEVLSAQQQSSNAPGGGKSSSLAFAATVTCYKLVEGAYSPLGKVGAAILMNAAKNEFRLILYKSQQQPVANTTLSPAFQFTVQANNYASFHDDARQTWSIMADKKEQLIAMAQKIALVSACSAGPNLNTVVKQTLEPGEGGQLQIGDMAEVRYTGYLFTNGSIGQKFDSNVGSEKLFRLQLGKGKVIKGWENGMVGSEKGSQCLLIIPPQLAYGQTGVPNRIPANATLIFDITVVRVKLNAKKAEPAAKPTEGQPQVAELPPLPADPTPGEPSQLSLPNPTLTSPQEVMPQPGPPAAPGGGSSAQSIRSRMAKLGTAMLPMLMPTGTNYEDEPETPGGAEIAAANFSSGSVLGPPLSARPVHAVPHTPADDDQQFMAGGAGVGVLGAVAAAAAGYRQSAFNPLTGDALSAGTLAVLKQQALSSRSSPSPAPYLFQHNTQPNLGAVNPESAAMLTGPQRQQLLQSHLVQLQMQIQQQGFATELQQQQCQLLSAQSAALSQSAALAQSAALSTPTAVPAASSAAFGAAGFNPAAAGMSTFPGSQFGYAGTFPSASAHSGVSPGSILTAGMAGSGIQPQAHAPSPSPSVTGMSTVTASDVSETRHMVGIVMDKMDSLGGKVDTLCKQSEVHGSMETATVVQNIQRIATENDKLKKEVLEKNVRLDTQTEKISELLQQNQRHMEQSNLLLEKRNDSFKYSSTQAQSALLEMEQEKVRLIGDLSQVTGQLSSAQLEVTNLSQREADLKDQLAKVKYSTEGRTQELTSLREKCADNDETIAGLNSKLKKGNTSARALQDKVTRLEEELHDAKLSNENFQQMLGERKGKMAEERKQQESEIEELKQRHEEELEALRKRYQSFQASSSSHQLQFSKMEEDKWQSKLDSERSRWERLVNSLTDEKKQLEQAVEKLQSRISRAGELHKTQTSELERAKGEVKSMTAWKDKHDTVRSKALEMRERFTGEINDLKARAEEADTEAERFKARLKTALAQKPAASPTTADSTAQVKLVMNGVFQSLRSKVAVDEEYAGGDILKLALSVIKEETLKFASKMPEGGDASSSEEDEEEEEEAEEEEDGEEEEEEENDDSEETSDEDEDDVEVGSQEEGGLNVDEPLAVTHSRGTTNPASIKDTLPEYTPGEGGTAGALAHVNGDNISTTTESNTTVKLPDGDISSHDVTAEVDNVNTKEEADSIGGIDLGPSRYEGESGTGSSNVSPRCLGSSPSTDVHPSDNAASVEETSPQARTITVDPSSLTSTEKAVGDNSKDLEPHKETESLDQMSHKKSHSPSPLPVQAAEETSQQEDKEVSSLGHELPLGVPVGNGESVTSGPVKDDDNTGVSPESSTGDTVSAVEMSSSPMSPPIRESPPPVPDDESDNEPMFGQDDDDEGASGKPRASSKSLFGNGEDDDDDDDDDMAMGFGATPTKKQEVSVADAPLFGNDDDDDDDDIDWFKSKS